MRVRDEALELLLPDADDAQCTHARKVTHFLRLLVDDAQAARASSVGIDLPRARQELELQGRAHLEATLRDLLRHHLEAAVPQDSFLWLGEPTMPLQTAWSAIEELRATWNDLPGVPEPGESPLHVAERLLAALEPSGASSGEGELWRARWTRLADGARAGERAFRALLERVGGPVEPGFARGSLAGAVECQLDRGGVREARTLLLEALPRVGATPRLRLLLAWSRLCLEDSAGAKGLLVGLRPWGGPLPASLVELRERRREWLPVLAGRLRAVPRSARPEFDEPARERSSIGASVLAVFAFRRGTGAQCLACDVAPALRAGLEAWMSECEGAVAVPGTLPNRVLVAARAACLHGDEGSPARDRLGGGPSRAVFVEPILDDEGEVAGWVHAEFEHHLVPGAARRAALARSWRETVLRHAPSAPGASSPSRAPFLKDATSSRRLAPGVAGAPNSLVPLASAGGAPTSDALGDAFNDLIEELGIKTAQRLWWAFDVSSGTPEPIAEGGLGQGFSEPAWGRRKALDRALSAGGPVSFEEPDERLAVHAGSGSGSVLLLRSCGRTLGLLALESSRRRDFKAADLERLQSVADRFGLVYRIAQFRSWHQARFGHDLWFDARRPDFREFAERLILAARTQSPVVLSGPPGAGKQIVARWLHFESPRGEGPLRVATCARSRPVSEWFDELRQGSEGTLVLEDLDRAAHEFQEELLRWLEGQDLLLDPGLSGESCAAGRPRLVFTLRTTLAEAARAGVLRADLAARLDRLQLRVPPLRQRREDILPLVECLARRFAEEEGLRPPTFSEESLALLWRQSWEGNVRELENFVYKLVLFSRELGPGPAHAVQPEHVLQIARRNHVSLARRLPSRHPLRSDLLAALRVSRTRGGRFNKTRASVFLGWDSDTLAARMVQARIRPGEECEESVWTEPASAETAEAEGEESASLEPRIEAPASAAPPVAEVQAPGPPPQTPDERAAG